MRDLLGNPRVWKSRQRFCVDIFVDHKTQRRESEGVGAIFMCLRDRDPNWNRHTIVYGVTAVFMILTIVVHCGILLAHCLLWEYQGCYGWTIMGFSGSQLLCYMASLVVWMVLKFVEDAGWWILSTCSISGANKSLQTVTVVTTSYKT